MIKLAQDTIDKEDIKSLVEWLSQDETPRLTKGPLTLEFEKAWAEKIGTKYSVFVNSGSSAILLGLYALLEGGYLKNKKVVISALSWATDVSSPMILGMEPILVDCNLEDLSCDLNYLEDVFKKENPAVLILVSVLGLVPRMDEVVALCERYDVILFEDVAESLGSKYQGKMLGSFGKIGIYSLYFGHHLSSLEGGQIVTNDFNLYELLLSCRSHGWDRDLTTDTKTKLRKEWDVDEFNAFYTFYIPSFNLRATDLQAKIGIGQLKKIDNFCEIRKNNFYHYLEKVKINELHIKERLGDYTSSFAFPIVSKNKSKIVKGLMENDIECRPLICGSMGRAPFWIKRYGVKALPNADIINDFGFYLPNHQSLTEIDIDFIAETVNGWK